MHSHSSEHAPAMVCTLLHNFVQQEHAPPGILAQQPGGSIVFSIAGMLNDENRYTIVYAKKLIFLKILCIFNNPIFDSI